MSPRRLAHPAAAAAAVAVASLAAACGGGSGTSDATVPVDIDNGSCGDMLRFTGEYVDWDTDARFCGINMAVLQVQGGGAMDATNPNGRFDLCIPSANATTLLDVTQPSANSECTAVPSGYTIPTVVVATKAVILAGALPSARAWTTERQASFFASIGTSYDSTKAQVHVHVDGTARAVSLTAAHGATQAIATTTWAAGDVGHEVFFPNVEVGAGTTTLSVASGAIGTGEIPLTAGTITSVTVHAP